MGVDRRRMAMARFKKVLNGLSVASLLVTGSLMLSTVTASADVDSWLQGCTQPTAHWYARAVSGYGNTTGTEDTLNTPSQWSVDQAASSTWDQAAWLNNDNNIQNALEGGLYSGYFGYDGSWTNSMRPYYTINQGESGQENSSVSIPENHNIALGVESGSGGVFVYDNTTSQSLSWFNTDYTVSLPAVNDAQGEVTATTNTWMGNGSGYPNEAFYLPQGSATWYLWGVNNTCANSPYWINRASAYSWTSGGY